MPWIILERTSHKGPEQVWVNSQKISFITQSPSRGAVLWSGKTQMDVIQTPERIMELIKKAQA